METTRKKKIPSLISSVEAVLAENIFRIYDQVPSSPPISSILTQGCRQFHFSCSQGSLLIYDFVDSLFSLTTDALLIRAHLQVLSVILYIIKTIHQFSLKKKLLPS